MEERKAKKAEQLAKSIEDKFQKLLKKYYVNIKLVSCAGGFSIVIKGLNIKLKREEALKAIDCDSIEDTGLNMEKIEQEISIMGKLDHPNIVKIFTTLRVTTTEDDYLFIVMELCDNTLSSIILEHPGGVVKAEARLYLGQIVDGVVYLHENNIVHRDLKPDNVFFKGNQIKIGDFNISKEIGTGKTTRASQMMLTYTYTAPERVTGEPGDQRLDSWSIGCIYYQLLVGSLPFRGDCDFEIMKNIRNIDYFTPKNADSFDLSILKMTLVNESNRKYMHDIKDFISQGHLEVLFITYIYID